MSHVRAGGVLLCVLTAQLPLQAGPYRLLEPIFFPAPCCMTSTVMAWTTLQWLTGTVGRIGLL